MTDERFDRPEFDDPAHDPVRELLASARVDTPIPADVVARLDATLAELTGHAAPADPVVVPLHRRARLGPRLLAAAAFIVVAAGGAVGLHQVLTSSGSNNAASADSATSAQVPKNAPELAAPLGSPTAGDFLTKLQDTRKLALTSGVPVFTTADFGDQVLSYSYDTGSTGTLNRGARMPTGHFGSTTTTAPSPPAANPTAVPAPTNGQNDTASGTTAGGSAVRSAGKQLASAARSCSGPRIAGTESYPIVLDGQPAVLVVHPAKAGSRLVQAWSCDGSVVLAYTTVPG